MTATVAGLLSDIERRLAAAGLDTPRRDAQLLLSHVLGLPPGRLRGAGGDPVSAAAQRRLDGMVARRLRREPVQRILGTWEFWSLELELGPDTLIPRPDTETVVSAALARLGTGAGVRRLVDLGTGTGALLLALLTELPAAWGLGTDISPGAAAVARRNAARLGLADRAALAVADWAEPLAGRFDLVVSNPPYIPAAEVEALEPEVRDFEPRRALAAGADGLDCYRRIAAVLPRLLEPGGLAVLEHGMGQGPAVAALLAEAGLGGLEAAADLEGRDRAVIARHGP